MPVVADFFKGTISGVLEKLVKPAGLVPAAALVLLNLAFIYPVARDDQLGWASNFSNLANGWQIVVLTALILAVGLLLQGAAVAVISVLQGYAWRDTPLGEWLKSREQGKLKSLRQRYQCADERCKQTLAWRIERRFGVEADAADDQGADKLEPTALGNALRALQHTLSKRYGIDIVTLLGHLEATPAVKDSPALAVVHEERDRLDLFANLAAVLSFFALECLAFYGKRGHWPAALLGAVALPGAYGAYQMAVAETRSWADAVAALFDLHRGDLRAQIRLRQPADADDERQLWHDASRFFRAPGERTAARLFDALPSAQTAKVTVAGDVDASLAQAKMIERRSGKLDGWTPLRSISYRILVARIAEAAAGVSSQLLVTDPRVALIEVAPVTSRVGQAGAEVLDDGASVALRWRLDGLGRGGSLLLAYELPLWLVRTESNLEANRSPAPVDIAELASEGRIEQTDEPSISFVRLEEGRRFRLHSDSARSDVTYSITACYLGAGEFTPPKLKQGVEDCKAQLDERLACWSDISFDPSRGVVTLELPGEDLR